jgi:hypothetical protein
LLGGGQSFDTGDPDSLDPDPAQVLGFTSTDVDLRIPIGFGLAYYLIGAVLLDLNGSKLHELAGKATQQIVESDDDLSSALTAISRGRSHVYWVTLGRYLLLHMWSLSVTSMIVWTLSNSERAVILYVCYVVAYTGKFGHKYLILCNNMLTSKQGFYGIRKVHISLSHTCFRMTNS